ncbi:Uncharacterised protein [Metamycoplasma arthritidis]|uniref:Uncharacterized protein n=1 Tax=Metamycoplasma arthritidis (strain 158L3-1) TaxID=243272 RepID=B3PN20_META1|nr:hypothetical protein [Metamycoplasma arthritidis]ACF07422.1 hypothetical protein MARTH_orf642 [Metamycoplasma arthritidis 158L3-1]VEU78944.1 Uncharacterised protein [Metamycoplasma arthritidis]
MKLKYQSSSILADGKTNEIFETDFVDYEEKVSNEFIILDFVDQRNTSHHLEISANEINIQYGQQKIKLIKNERVNTIYRTKVKDFNLDWYLKHVDIGFDEIKFEYDILQETNLITSNIVKLITRK